VEGKLKMQPELNGAKTLNIAQHSANSSQSLQFSSKRTGGENQFLEQFKYQKKAKIPSNQFKGINLKQVNLNGKRNLVTNQSFNFIPIDVKQITQKEFVELD
jgi:hypothetical protein